MVRRTTLKGLINMEIKTIVTVIIAGMLGAVVFVGLLPVFAETSSANDTFTNDGYFRVNKVTDTDGDINIAWDYTNPYVFTVNDVDASIPFGSTNAPIFPYSVISADSWALRFISTNSGTQIDLAVFGAYSSLVWGASTLDGKNVTIALSGGTATITKEGSAPITLSYTTAYVIDANGEYTMKKSTDTAYLNGDSEIYSTGRTGATFDGVNVNLNINVQATINDGPIVTMIYPDTYTVSNEVVNYSKVNTYLDLYAFDNITFDVTDGSDNTITANYGQVIVPYEVTAEKSIHPDGPTTALLNLLPVLIAIGLIVGIAGAIFIKRM